MRDNIKGSAILCLAALIWGLAFVAQSAVADAVPPFLLNSLRSFIGAAFLLLLFCFKNRKNGICIIPKDKAERKTVLTAGLVCGVVLTLSINLQQFGIAFYPVGTASEAHAGFITALYVILVPVFSALLGKKTGFMLWAAVIIALGGFYLLCLSGGIDGLYLGDLFVLMCAVSFAFHILTVDRYVEAVGGIRLSMLQFVVCGVLSGIMSLIFEYSQINWQSVLSGMPYILYLGIMSSGIAYTLQIIGQRFAEPTVASLSMSLESVFAALGGWLISGNSLSVPEACGCVLVFAAIIIAQLPQKNKV